MAETGFHLSQNLEIISKERELATNKEMFLLWGKKNKQANIPSFLKSIMLTLEIGNIMRVNMHMELVLVFF